MKLGLVSYCITSVIDKKHVYLKDQPGRMVILDENWYLK
jgi:hypothetical protein